MADDMDMMAMMGITGFGKQTKKRELDPKRFEKNRREEVCFVWSAAARGRRSSRMLSQGQTNPRHTSYGVRLTKDTSRNQR